MITEQQIDTLSRKYKINQTIVTREFIQILFLKELYEENFSKDVYFKGGTAIRLLYGGKRFSEDLDFTVNIGQKPFQSLIKKFFTKLENQYPFTIKRRKSIVGFSYLITAKLPFIKSLIYVKLDFSMRENVLQPAQVILNTEYPVIIQSFIKTLSKDELLAEKIRATLKRSKHRDLYDLWILQELGAKVDVKLLQKKLAYYKEVFNVNALMRKLNKFTRKGFIQDLRPFVPINERTKLGDLFDYVLAYVKKSFNS